MFALRRRCKGLVRAKHHVAEVPVDLHELVGGSVLFNPAILQHQHAIHVRQHRASMGDDERRTAFREHGQMGHTFSVFDEEVHVPAWIDAPPGTLTESEQARLRAKKDAWLFHVDMAPTLLDLMGVLDDRALDPYRAQMIGTSLFREGVTERALPMTNCGGVWNCAFENWGVMKKSRKIEARAWDDGWHCYDLAEDPEEEHDLGVGACPDLLKEALGTFGRDRKSVV